MTINHEFETYLRRTLPVVPEALTAGSLPPSTWTGHKEEWHQLTAVARQSYEYESTRKFCLEIANGWSPAELANGQLAPGARTDLAGRVIRPLPSTIGRDIEEGAAQALDEMRTLNVSSTGC